MDRSVSRRDLGGVWAAQFDTCCARGWRELRGNFASEPPAVLELDMADARVSL